MTSVIDEIRDRVLDSSTDRFWPGHFLDLTGGDLSVLFSALAHLVRTEFFEPPTVKVFHDGVQVWGGSDPTAVPPDLLDEGGEVDVDIRVLYRVKDYWRGHQGKALG